MTMRIAVVVATRGRGEALVHLLNRLKLQTRLPDLVCISGVEESDVTAARKAEGLPLRVVFGPPGLTTQRNTGIREILRDADAIVFFDDDFLPAASWLREAEDIFSRDPEVLGFDGRTLADGADAGGVPVDAAGHLLADYDASTTRPDREIRPTDGLYGCNMAFRSTVFRDAMFDERLPLYGWLEDLDFSCQVRKMGSLVTSRALCGVHLGLKSGKTSGLRFGISQVINPIYLWRKGSIAGRDAVPLILTPLLMNIAKALRPEPYIDRRGRLRGNLMGLAYVLSGRTDPAIVVQVK